MPGKISCIKYLHGSAPFRAGAAPCVRYFFGLRRTRGLLNDTIFAGSERKGVAVVVMSTAKRLPLIDTIIRDWLTGIAAGGGEVFSGGKETSFPMTCFAATFLSRTFLPMA